MSKINYTDTVRKILMEKLTFGEYPPGHTFKLRDLMEDPAFTGMSQTPIREALLQLCAANILIGQRGFSVRVPIPSAEHLTEVRQIRTQLEIMAALQHINDWDDKSLRKLKSFHLEMMEAKKNGDIQSHMRANAMLHMFLCRVDTDSYLKSMIRMLWAITGPTVGYLYGEAKGPTFAGEHPHDSIIKALKKRDPVALESALRHDLRGTGDRIIAALIANVSPEAVTLQPFKTMELVRQRTRDGKAMKST